MAGGPARDTGQIWPVASAPLAVSGARSRPLMCATVQPRQSRDGGRGRAARRTTAA